MGKNDKRSVTGLVFGIIGTVVFFVSYMPFLLLINYAIDGMQAGLFGGPYVYGWEAVSNAFIWLCIFPVYPVCMLYQLLFGLLYIRKRSLVLKIFAASIPALIIAAILISCLSYRIKENKLLEDSRDDIIDYLEDKYNMSEDQITDIQVDEYDGNVFDVYTTVLPGNRSFTVSLGDDGNVAIDGLISQFIGFNDDFLDGLSDYVADEYDIPDVYTPHIYYNIESIDFEGYEDGDSFESLYVSTEYRINGFQITYNNINDDTMTELLNDLWSDEIPKIADKIDDYFMVYIYTDNTREYYIQVFMPDDGSLDETTALVDLYSDSTVNSDLVGQRIELHSAG
ncbi:MAG: hypothetical protein IJ757_05985 [Clostridiales bacterium]|nr:hypothetical protein [Clostridiales bacterium]